MVRNGWYRESFRHGLAAKGISTRKYSAAKTRPGRALERVLKGYDTRSQRAFLQGDIPERQKLAVERKEIRGPLSEEELQARDVRLRKVEAVVASRGGGVKQSSKKGESPTAKFASWTEGHTNVIIAANEMEKNKLIEKQGEIEREIQVVPESKRDPLLRELRDVKINIRSLRNQNEYFEQLKQKAKENRLSSSEKKTLGEHTEIYEALTR